MKWTRVAACTATLLLTGAAGSGCLSRPVGKQPPTTKVNFTSTISQQAVDKVDLLFAIDNSASMGDKQQILAQAVPDLLTGLLQPQCIDKNTGAATAKRADPKSDKEHNFGCDAGTEPEFKPVTDMHIGIVSSSLGNFGGDVCPSGGRNNDRALLINATNVADAKPNNFLAWYPANTENNDKRRHPDPATPVGDYQTLQKDFTDLVKGVDQTGCGLEAQLESVYRFLIQPDPWVNIHVDPNTNQAVLGDDVDFDVLKQRADFLRPDSLVAIIMLTDEDDSSSDPLAIGGQGWAFMSKNFPGSKVFRGQGAAQGTTAPRGTTTCSTQPGSDDCTSCGFQGLCADSDPSCQKLKADANCQKSGIDGQSGEGYNGYYGPTDDDLNVRFHRMKERYGIDPQYPLKRYIDGLTKFRVPDRKSEHVINESNGRRQIAAYTHTPKCTNPLFAAKLPTDATDTKQLCDLPRSTRTPDLIFFGVVGGVPHQLLYPPPAGQKDGYDTTTYENNRMTEKKWVTILGKDPLNFDYSGIDPHMIQSITPRPGIDGEKDLPKGQNGSDPFQGREWNTNKHDLQFACTFDLPANLQRTCDQNSTSCDCTQDATSTDNPPLCGTGAQQVRAKAYPTIREFEVVRALGDQGIAASLCPILLDDPNSPKYGYRPAVAAIIDRLKNALTTQCLPQKLKDPDQSKADPPVPVPCLVLAQLSDPADNCAAHGLKPPADDILKVFKEQQQAETGNVADGGLDLAALPVCEIDQTAVAPGDTCESEADPRFCYVENNPGAGKNPAGRCPQALLFSAGTASLAGARFSLQCIKQFAAGQASGDTQTAQ